MSRRCNTIEFYDIIIANITGSFDNHLEHTVTVVRNSKQTPAETSQPRHLSTNLGFILFLNCLSTAIVGAHGPPQDRDNEDITMGRKMGAKWCGMAKVCNHDRIPICGVSHAGDVMGFRDLCDMFDFNCIRRRNYRQTGCPEDKSLLTVSRRPTNSFYDD